MNNTMGDFWVFGYGSLIWNPGFTHIGTVSAKIYGLHRALCIHSWVHRGTVSEPGLVLGLAKGGSCHGVAFKVESKERNSVIGYLRARELVTDVYKEVWRTIHLPDGETEMALTYVADPASPQYSDALTLERQIDVVKSANGKSGANIDYILKTVEHLKSISIRDRHLERIVKQITNY